MSMWTLFSASLERNRDRVLVEVAGESYTGADLLWRAASLHAVLAGMGMRQGQTCAFLVDNSIAMVDGYLACARGGFVAAPIPTRRGYVDVGDYVRRVDAKAVVAESEYVSPVLSQLHSAGVEVLETDTRRPARGARSYSSEVESTGLSATLGPAPLGDGDPYCLAMTGGSTGSPKAALQTHGNWKWSATGPVSRWELTVDDTHLLVLPLCHVAWFTLAAHLLAGSRTIIHAEWSPKAALSALANEGVTTWNIVPTMLSDVLEAGGDAFGTPPPDLRLIDLAGSRVAPNAYERGVGRFGPVFGMAYGMTESAGAVSLLLPDEVDPQRDILDGCVGRPLPGTDVRILGPDGATLSAGREGEVAITGPVVSPEYRPLGQQEGAASAIPIPDALGNYRTGDLGHFDEDGYLFITGRQKEMIKTGGYNVYPREVEAVLVSHPRILKAAVFGRPHDKWVEQVVAAVVPDGPLREDTIRDYCRDRLPGFKVPQAVMIVDEIPRTPVGKADVQALLFRALHRQQG